MTPKLISPKSAVEMARRKVNYDKMSAGFPPDTFVRIDRVRQSDEDRKQFLRVAVEKELRYREKKLRPKPRKDDGGS